MQFNPRAIKCRRLINKQSQADAARAAGWGRSVWCDLEAGRQQNPTTNTLIKICQVLQCEVSDIVN